MGDVIALTRKLISGNFPYKSFEFEKDIITTSPIQNLWGQTPSWLHGWWSVIDNGQYFYFFGQSGRIQYTTIKPDFDHEPSMSGACGGKFTILANSTILISWLDESDAAVALEKFLNAKPGSSSMKGIGIGGSTMTAARLFPLD